MNGHRTTIGAASGHHEVIAPADTVRIRLTPRPVHRRVVPVAPAPLAVAAVLPMLMKTLPLDVYHSLQA